MLTEKNLLRVLIGAISVLAAAMVAWSLIVICRLFTPIPYWDQWEMAKYLAAKGPFSLSYLLEPHAEHIIATSKLLFFIDYWYFGYANRFLVGTIVVVHLLIAYTLASILVGFRWSSSKFLWVCVFSALMLSLAQWENLTIGFQTQFGLTSLFAIHSTIFAARLASETRTDWWALVGLVVCTPLTVFSMGNGIAVVCCFALIAILMRARLSRAVIMLAIYALCLGIFISQRNADSAVHIGGNSLFEMLQFFMAVLGSTFTRNFSVATAVGAVVCLLYLIEFIYTGVLPWVRRQAVDRATVVFLSIGVFALASAAAVTIGRISLGPVAALTSRYATPNILLYSSLLGVGYRNYILNVQSERFAMRLLCIFGAVGLVIACVLTSRPSNLNNLTARSDALTTAGYFLLSGVRSDEIVADLYPRPPEVSLPIQFIEQNKLNIFSPDFGLRTLGRTEIADVKDLPVCSTMELQPIFRMDAASWKVSGRIKEVGGEKPDWIIATTLEGRVLGYAPPKKRQERGAAVFDAPVHEDSQAFDQKAYIVAQAPSNGLCRYKDVVDLSDGYVTRKMPQGDIATDYDEALSLGGDVSLVPEPAQHLEHSGYKVQSTWQGDDTATGTIRYSVAAKGDECPAVFVGIMRGPTTNGLSIEISEAGMATRQISLDTISEHQWWWLNVRGAASCKRSSQRAVTLIDNGNQWGAWAAITTPFAVGSIGQN